MTIRNSSVHIESLKLRLHRYGLRRRFRRAAAAAGLLAAVLLATGPARADVLSEMNNFWRGAAVNTTGPTAFQGQASGHWTLGNLYLREQRCEAPCRAGRRKCRQPCRRFRWQPCAARCRGPPSEARRRARREARARMAEPPRHR